MLLSEENINDIGHIYNSIYHNGINEETQVFVEQLSDEELLNLYTEHVINEVITEMYNNGLLNEGVNPGELFRTITGLGLGAAKGQKRRATTAGTLGYLLGSTPWGREIQNRIKSTLGGAWQGLTNPESLSPQPKIQGLQ